MLFYAGFVLSKADTARLLIIEHSGGTNCCPWCAGLVGKWELKNAPSDVFGVHDNCTCMVAYTNSRGVRSQGLGRSRFVDVNYTPTRLTDGAERGAGEPKKLTESPAKGQPRRLTGGANGGIIGSGGNGGGKPPAGANIPREPSDEYKAIVDAFTNMKNSDDIVDTVIKNHLGLAEFTPQTMKDLLESAGYEIKPLNRSATWKGIPFEQGGGDKKNFGGDAYFQYHPEKGSHHGGAYWRIANGKHGDKRYKMDGTEQNK